MRRIGLLGGTFNPIHIGHLALAEWALEEKNLEEIWLIPTGIPYMKDLSELASCEDRLYMTELAVKQNPRFRCLDIEARKKQRSYSFETLEQLHLLYPDNEFFFILGADCLFSIENWKNPDRIFRYCTIIAAVRDDSVLSVMEEKKLALERKYQGTIHLLPFLRMSVSSTEIRQRFRSGKSVRYLVPDAIISYMEEKRLYREENS